MTVNVREELSKAGVTRLLFIRHANASKVGAAPMANFDTPHDWKMNDQVRPITDVGKVQAESARKWFIEGVGLENNKVLVASGARRAVETLQVMAETRTGDTAQVEVQMLPCLHPAGIAPRCEALFEKLNYKPLNVYYREPDGEAALAEYGQIVMTEFVELLKNVGQKPGHTISMFGHALFLNAAAMEFAKALGFPENDLENLKAVDLGEAEGISIEIKDDALYKILHMHCRALSIVSSHPLF